MLSVRRKVGYKLEEKLKDAKLNITYTKNGSPSKFPTLNMDSLGEPSIADDLEHVRQNAIISTIELKTYCVGSKGITSARNYMDKAGDVMYQMGYDHVYGPEDISTGSINTMVARFRRTFGAGDIENM